MIIHDCIQGTPDWLALRAGIPTASQFDMILTKSGKPSQSAERYMLTLLAERIMGHPIAEHVSMWMQRGSQMEREAVAFYELQRNMDTESVGFITNDEETYGASPDRLVGTDGLLEVKSPKEYIHVGYMMQSGSAYDAYRVQVQGQMWIAERQWADVLSYHPDLPWALARIERDAAFIKVLAGAVKTFSMELERQWQLCVERGWAPKSQPRTVLSASDMIREALLDAQRQKESV